MKVLVSAAEASSDLHGAELLRRLGGLVPQGTELEAYGIGGRRLQAAGLRAVVDSRELLAMGLTEVLGRLPRIVAALAAIEAAIEKDRPDVAVLIDYPDFHMKLAKRLKERGIPAVCYIPPKVWVWRKKRVELLRSLYQRVLCIFPFEEAVLRKESVPAVYVGNPLLDELPLGMSRAEARRELGIGESEKVLAVLLGSRPAEIKRHLEPMLEGAVRGAAQLRSSGALGSTESLRILVPIPSTLDFEAESARIQRWLDTGGWRKSAGIVDVRVLDETSSLALASADCALVKSGTSTLEAALLNCPHAVVYRPSRVTGWAYRNLLRRKGPVGLVNLVRGWKSGDPYVADEILMNDVTAKRLAQEVVTLFTDGARNQRMVGDFMKIRDCLRNGNQSPSANAANQVLEVWREAAGRT